MSIGSQVDTAVCSWSQSVALSHRQWSRRAVTSAIYVDLMRPQITVLFAVVNLNIYGLLGLLARLLLLANTHRARCG